MTITPIISVRDVSKYFGSFVALQDISFDIIPGEIFALLGPSGCGKSTLLRIIAGLETQSEGDVVIDNKDMAGVPANKRPVNMVFQSYAVFPHMSVADNVAYGLKLERVPKAEIKVKVTEALEQVHLSQFSHRMPDQLSGGQRQRVALARALVKRPRVLLLDEPLSALDAKLRDAMRLELVKLQESVGVSFVIVTHDQSEAMAMADRIAVLKDGKLRQLDSPAALYKNPCDQFVADFIGRINMFSVNDFTIDGDTVSILTDDIENITFPIAMFPENTQNLAVAVRPERVRVSSDMPANDMIIAEGKLGDIAFQGDSSLVEVILPSDRSITVLASEIQSEDLMKLELGATVYCSWNTGDMLLLPENETN